MGGVLPMNHGQDARAAFLSCIMHFASCISANISLTNANQLINLPPHKIKTWRGKYETWVFD
jgi:hypothetical protein